MKHIDIALREYGVKEGPKGEPNPRIIQYHHDIGFTHIFTDKKGWCSEFVNWCLLKAGLKGTKSAVAVAFATWGQPIDVPNFGDIVLLSDKSGSKEVTHIGFVIALRDKQIWVLGGNQDDEVNITKFKESRVVMYRTFTTAAPIPTPPMSYNETDTYRKLKDKPADNVPEFLIVHHSGGTNADPLADTSNHTAAIMEAQHLANGWEGLGYQFVIHKDGAIWRGRPETYHGSHTTTHNKKSIGICLAGNFDATMPTDLQKASLTSLLKEMMLKYNIPVSKIVPHRTFAVKTCYGNKLGDDWARLLVSN